MATNSDCLFCKIASGAIPVTRLYENEHVLAFPDIHPQAPVHILIIPKQHFNSLAHVTAEESELLGQLIAAAGEIAQQQGLGLHNDGGGYRVIINTGPDGGQTVDHLHVHLLGGRHMGWPPG
ncbi:MAG: histidine triad nucleotide-binding protein [Acidobacteriaceae bacterium]